MTDSPDYCEILVKDADKDRFLATLFVPADRRPDLFALYAFDLETTAIPHRVRDPIAGEIRFQWWHDGLSGVTDIAGHPVATALRAALSRRGVPLPLALAAIDARRRALYGEDDNGAEFELRASESEGAIYEMAARMLTDEANEALKLASHHAGVATAAAHADARVPNRETVVREHLDAARALLEAIPEKALPAFLRLALVAKSRHQLPQWRKQWILWRASKNLAKWI